jgi:tripartite-type tricarboxylate transporter receptor subunit TctC
MRTGRMIVLLAIGTLFGFTTWVVSAAAQEAFYKGKTIRLVVGLAPGGGYDLYSRVIGRHMGKHIPGNPTIVVENMAGAGSVIAANHMYKAAKPDGLTIGHILGGLFLQQLLGNPAIEFDGRKFEYLGVPAQDHFLIGLSKATGITSFESWMASKKPVKLGGVSPGGATDDVPKVLEATLGLPIKVVSGYKGTGPIRLAFEAGEVDGVCNAWESFKSTWRKQLDSGDVVIILQATLKERIRNFPISRLPLIF